MNNNQESKFTMSLALRNLLMKSSAITTTLPGFIPIFNEFDGNLNLIQAIREQQEVNKSGLAQNKKFLRTDLIDKAFDASHKIEVYATLNNNTVLAKQVHYPKTRLDHVTDSKLVDIAQVILDAADSVITELSAYLMNEAILDDLNNANNLFKAAIPTTREGTIGTKQATDELARLFKVNDSLLAKLDLLVDLVNKIAPQFYAIYKDTRKIIDKSRGSIDFKALIIDSATGLGIKRAKVKFELQNGTLAVDAKPIIKLSYIKGGLIIKNLADGTYTITVTKTGYKEQVLVATVANGDKTKLTVKLEKI